MATGRRGAAVPVSLVLVAALFLGAIAYLVASSMVRREQPTYVPSALAPRPLSPDSAVVETLTVDARGGSRWVFVDFDRRSVVPLSDTAGWDLAVRRFHVMAAQGATDLGTRPFEEIRHAPDTGYRPNVMAGDTVNAALRRWYRYSLTSHLLEPGGHAYAVRTAPERAAIIQMLSYYCPGVEAGCFTIRYRYPVPVGAAGRE